MMAPTDVPMPYPVSWTDCHLQHVYQHQAIDWLLVMPVVYRVNLELVKLSCID